MFYDQNQVEDLLSCSSCQIKYDLDKNKPLLLPCYKTLCEACIRSGISNDESKIYRYKCFYCSNNHDIIIGLNDNSPSFNLTLPLNESLVQLLKLKPVDVHKAELIRKLADLLKKIKLSLDELDYIESSSKQNFLDYFDLIKNEINQSTNYLIEQANQYRDKLILEIDHIKEQSIAYLIEFFGKNSKLNEIKMILQNKKNEWQNVNNFTEQNTLVNINEANKINEKLNETKQYLNNITRHKLVFNQREPIHLDDRLSKSLVGQLDLNLDFVDHNINLKLFNDIIKIKCYKFDKNDDSCPLFSHQTIHLIPIHFKRLFLVNKASYSEYSDYNLSIIDLKGKLLYSNKENQSCKVNACGCFVNNIILSVTDYKTGREMLKLYDTSLKLIKSVFTEFKSKKVFLNDMFIYVLLKDSQYPYLIKFDYNLVKLSLFENLASNNELFISFVVDKLLYISSQSNKIYFFDNVSLKIKIYCELTTELIQTINLSDSQYQQSYCSIFIDSILNMNQQFLCLNFNEKTLKIFDRNNKLLVENKLSDEIKNISRFYLTQDGSYVFIDYLNDSIFYYN